MDCIEYSGLKDLFHDWRTAIGEYKIDLKNIKIYRIDKISHNKRTIADVTVTDTNTLKQEKKKVVVPAVWARQLEKSGVFYKTSEGARYIPSAEVNGHIMSDHFHIRYVNLDMTREEKDSLDMKLADKFRKMGYIIFVAKVQVNGYSDLLGMKSAHRMKSVNVLDITEILDKKYDLIFFTGYCEQTECSLDFVYDCECKGWNTADGTPYCLCISDSATGRRAIRIDVVAKVNNKRFIIDSMEINHRTASSAAMLADQVADMVESHRSTVLNLKVDAETIVKKCLKYVPKKAQQKAMDFIMNTDMLPVEAAYDLMDENLFNLKQKQHKIHSYDGGRRKYELALGSIIKCC